MTDTVMVPIEGREVEVKTLNETQKMMMLREAQVLKSTRQEVGRKLRAVAAIVDIIESAIVDEEDREYVADLAGTGKIEFGEMLRIAGALDQPQEEPTKAVATVRRAARKR